MTTVDGGPRPRELWLERRAEGVAETAEAIARAARVLEEWRPERPLVLGGDPLRAMRPTVKVLEAYLVEWRAARASATLRVFHLSSGDRDRDLNLFLCDERLPGGSIESLHLSLDGESTVPDEVLAEAGRAFGAYRAYIRDARLQARYLAASQLRSLRELPPDLRQFAPDLGVNADDLPELLLPHKFDRRRVPDFVHCTNLWDGEQVRNLGRSRVEAAGWARVVPQVDGSLLLAVSAGRFDPDSAAELSRLRHILTALDLRAAQERVAYR